MMKEIIVKKLKQIPIRILPAYPKLRFRQRDLSKCENAHVQNETHGDDQQGHHASVNALHLEWEDR